MNKPFVFAILLFIFQMTPGSPVDVTLTYDSTTFAENNNSQFFNCEMHFSDSKGSTTKLHAYQYIGSMHGYKLYDEELCKHYRGAKFKITWNRQAGFNRIEDLELLSTEKYLRHRTIKHTTDDDIATLIYNAEAGDSIVLQSGVYFLEKDIQIDADHIVLTGEPGAFIFGDVSASVIDIGGNYVTVKDLYLSHKNAETSCRGDVIFVNSNSCKNVTIKNCDINGCGVVGITIYNPYGESIDYRIEENLLHNNSRAAFATDAGEFQEQPTVPGVRFSNNLSWNNGPERTKEPEKFKIVFCFGPTEKNLEKLKKACADCEIISLGTIKDSEMDVLINQGSLMVGRLNPSEFSNGKKKGVLVYEKEKPIEFLRFKKAVSYLGQ